MLKFPTIISTQPHTHRYCDCYHYSITHIDQRLCSITKASNEKWNSLFERCLRKLGFQHNQPHWQGLENSLSIWNYWHLISSQSKPSTPPILHKQSNVKNSLQRSNSLPIRFKYPLNKHNVVSPVHQPLSHTLSSTKKGDNEQLHHMMKEYLEKVSSLNCLSVVSYKLYICKNHP